MTRPHCWADNCPCMTTADRYATHGNICTYPGCDGTHYAHGLCEKHAIRLKTHGDPAKTWAIRRTGPCTCSPGCPRPIRARGLCGPAYARRYRAERKLLNA